MVMRSVWQSSFVLLFTFNYVSAGTNPNCPAGWLSDSALNNKCYKPYATLMIWMDAEIQCRKDSDFKGHLASIHNAFEQNYLIGIAHDNGLQNIGGWMWIGLQNLNTPNSDTYAWIDGSPLDYTNWVAGAPSKTGYEHGICMQIFDAGGTLSKWYTDDCRLAPHPFICQIGN